MIKALFITPWFPTKENPITGSFIAAHLSAIKEAGVELGVLHLIDEDESIGDKYQIQHLVRDGIPIFEFRTKYSFQSPRHIIWIALWIIKLYRSFARQYFEPDLIHTNVYYTGIFAALLKHLFNRRFIITEHSGRFTKNRISLLDECVAKIAHSNASEVTVVSRTLRDGFISHGVRGNYTIIPNILTSKDLPSVPKVSKSMKIVSVGHLEEIKGFQFVLPALAILFSKGIEFEYHIVGDGPLRSKLQRQVDELNISKKVTFHGYQNRRKVDEILGSSHVFILLSEFESFGMVYLEALQAGVPVVCSNIPSLRELLPRDLVEFVDHQDSAAIAAAILGFWKGVNRESRLKTNQYINETYSATRIGLQFKQLYKQLV